MNQHYNPYRSRARFVPLLAGIAVLALLAGMVWVLVGVTPMETLQYQDGRSYEGNVMDGAPHGDGRMQYPAGDANGRTVYEGQWQNGRRQGTGTLTWADGARLAGSWLADAPDGPLTLTLPDGTARTLIYTDGRCTDPAAAAYAP